MLKDELHSDNCTSLMTTYRKPAPLFAVVVDQAVGKSYIFPPLTLGGPSTTATPVGSMKIVPVALTNWGEVGSKNKAL